MVFALAAFAVPHLALGQFASTKFNPASQTANVGTNFNVDVVLTDPAGGYALNGVEVWINFDAAKLQAVSMTTGGSSPFTNVTVNQIDNTNGKLRYKATGGAINGASFAVAKIVFTPIAAGTSVLDFANVNTDIVGFGPFGVNGLAVDGSVTIVAPTPTQTLTILGGSGNVGDIAANVEYYNPATGQWQPAYLANYAPYGHPITHPWGAIAGTNRWINYKVDGGSDPGTGPTSANTLWYLYRVRFNVAADAQNAKMTFSIKADNYAQVAINGVNTGPVIEGQANGVNADAVFAQNLVPGENTITINVGDYGGLNGFNFRLDLTVDSAQPLEIVEPVSDTTPPVITAPANITKEATSAAGAVVTFTATANDAVSGAVSVTATPPSGTTFPIGLGSVALRATDAAGNTANASILVVVQDTIAPVITSVPANVTVEATSAAGAVATFGSATATDAVGVQSLTYSAASGSTFALGTTTVTVTAKDAAGNSSTDSFNVTVQDTIAPAVTVPANITVEATGASGATVTYAAATATDAVGVTSLTYSAASGSTFAIGTTTVTVTATDRAGNTKTESFTVTVQDTIAPAVTVPANITAEATSASGATVNYAAATATDAVGVTSLTYSAASGSTFALGTTTVTVTAKDAAGHITTGSFTVTVEDTIAPALTVPANITAEATGPNGATVAYPAAVATDAVGVTSLTYSTPSGTVFPIGTTTITVTARDAAGHVTTGSFTIRVADTTAPVIGSLAPSTATLWPPNHQMVAVTLNLATTDAVGVTAYDVTVTSNEPDNGLGDGDTANDIQITGNGTLNPRLNLRAERAGNGNGRIYTITVVARDAAGNLSVPRTTTVSVPKSQGGR